MKQLSINQLSNVSGGLSNEQVAYGLEVGATGAAAVAVGYGIGKFALLGTVGPLVSAFNSVRAGMVGAAFMGGLGFVFGAVGVCALVQQGKSTYSQWNAE